MILKIERFDTTLNVIKSTTELTIENVVYREVAADVAIKLTHITHNQVSASNEWIITHNMGRYPVVQTFNSAGDKIEGRISNISINQVKIVFGRALIGKAILGA